MTARQYTAASVIATTTYSAVDSRTASLEKRFRIYHEYGCILFKKMVKLTPELINQSMQFINPCRDRELDLRGKCILFVIGVEGR